MEECSKPSIIQECVTYRAAVDEKNAANVTCKEVTEAVSNFFVATYWPNGVSDLVTSQKLGEHLCGCHGVDLFASQLQAKTCQEEIPAAPDKVGSKFTS